MNVENEYRLLTDAMPVVERVRRAEALSSLVRTIWFVRFVRRRADVRGRLKREVALRQYGSDPGARRLIDEWPVGVSD